MSIPLFVPKPIELMKKTILIYLLLFFSLSIVSAQGRGLYSNKSEYGGYLFANFGPAYILGDTYAPLYEKTILDGNNWESTIGFRQTFPENFGFSVNLGYANYAGEDIKGPPVKKHQDGFYSYSSDVLELTFRAEYTLKFGERFKLHQPHSVYGFFGIGGVSMNVKPNSANALPVVPSAMGAIIPFGVGYRFEMNNFCIGLEGVAKMGFTDDIDGYRPHGTADDNLVNFSLTLGYKIF